MGEIYNDNTYIFPQSGFASYKRYIWCPALFLGSATLGSHLDTSGPHQDTFGLCLLDFGPHPLDFGFRFATSDPSFLQVINILHNLTCRVVWQPQRCPNLSGVNRINPWPSMLILSPSPLVITNYFTLPLLLHTLSPSLYSPSQGSSSSINNCLRQAE